MSKPAPHVLVVDDDRFIQKFVADHLQKLGFAVSVERDGEWALKTFENRRFDAVILDLLLPGMSGYDVARQLRATPQGQRTPIVMISGVYRNALHRKEAVERHGAVAFLEKPLTLPLLEKTLREALGPAYPSTPEPMLAASTGGAEHLADAGAKAEVSLVEQTARSVASFPSIRGEFAQRAFPELLAEIYRWRATGALLLRREKVKKIVYFKDGAPQFVKSNLLSECLGRILVKERLISEAECEESLKRMKASGRQQGTVLIEMGSLSPQNLVYALGLQLQAKLFEVFAWETGEYQFSPKIATPPETVGLELTTAAIIHEGIRRAYGPARLQRALGEVDALFPTPVDNALYALQDLGLGDDEQRLLQSIDGTRSVTALRALKLLPPLETDRLLYALKCAQMVSLSHTPLAGKPRISFPSLPAVKVERLRLVRDEEPELEIDEATPVSGMLGDPSAPRANGSGSSLLPELAWPHGPSSDGTIERERLAAKVAALRKMDFFEILGVPTTASTEQIQDAFVRRAREHHPDRHQHFASAEVHHLVEQIYQLITAAHETLSDPEERARYAAQIAEGRKAELGEDVGKILAAESRFQRGEELLRQAKYRDALDCFQEAVRLYEREGEFHAYLGWAQFQADPGEVLAVNAALRALGKAIALNPKADKAYLFSGYIYKAQGKTAEAEHHFEKAIQCNPGCTEALKELSILSLAASLRAR